MKRVLALITASYGGGAERLLLNQIKYYNKEKIELHVITLRKGNLEKEFQKFKNYKSLNLKSRFSFKGLFEIIHYIKQHNIEIVHSHLFEADAFGFLTKIFIPQIRLISTKHNTNDFRKKLYWGLLNKIISLPTYKVITVSDTVKRFVLKYEFINKNKVVTIYNGIDTQRFRKKNTSKLRKELKLKKSDFIIGIVGRLHKQKGHKFLFQAVKKIKDQISGLKLLVIGDGELKKEFKDRVKKLHIEKNVLFLGFRNDIPELYSLMNVFCLPSLYEGLPLVLAEAMSTETLVVCSDIPNNMEIVVNGECGIVTRGGDSDEMTKVFLDIYKNSKKYEIIKRNARIRVIKKFDYKTNLKKIEEVYLK